MFLLGDLEEVELTTNQVLHSVFIERSRDASKTKDEESDKPSHHSEGFVELITSDGILLYKEGVIEGEIVVKCLAGKAIIGDLHLLEGIDCVCGKLPGFGGEADLIIIGNDQF